LATDITLSLQIQKKHCILTIEVYDGYSTSRMLSGNHLGVTSILNGYAVLLMLRVVV
jgi:hypothetical protein